MFFISTWWWDCKKMQKKKKSLFFFKSSLSILRCTWTGRINLKIFLRYHINYLSIWLFMSHPWFPSRVKSQYKNFDKSWWTYFVPCFILKKGTKYVRQDLSKVFVFWLDIVVEIDKIFMPVRGQHRPKRLQRKHVFNVCMHARWCTCLCMYLNPR